MTQVTLTANTSDIVSQLEKINTTLSAMQENQAKVGESGKKATKEVADGAEKATNKWTELNSKIEVFGKVIEGGLGYLTKFKDVILEMEGFQTQATALALMSREGQNLNNVLANSVEITRGVVNQYDVLAATNDLMIKGFNLSEDSLTKLIDVSAIYSSVTGEKVASVMQKIAMASQRERDAIFEKMGVYIKSKEVLENYAKTMGTTADKLDEATKSAVLLETATDKMKTKFEETGLSAASLESPITHTFKKAETAIKQAQDTVVALAASMYVDVVGAMEYVFMKAGGMKDEAVWKMQDESLAKDTMSRLKTELEQLAASEARRIAEFKALDFSEREKRKQTEAEETKKFEEKHQALMDKVQLLKDTVGVGVYGDAYGFITDETAKQIQALEQRVAGIGSLVVQKASDIEALKNKAGESTWLKFADLPAPKMTKEAEKAIDNEIMKMTEYIQKSMKETLAKQSSEMDMIAEGLFGFTQRSQTATKEASDKIIKDTETQLDWLASAKKDAFDVDMMIAEQRIEHEKKLAEQSVKIKEQEMKEKQRILDIGHSVLNSAANTFYEGIISSEEDILQRVAAVALQQAGSKIFADGLERMWRGGGDVLRYTNPLVQAEGAKQLAYGIAEVTAGIGFGYSGKAAMPGGGNAGSESKSKESASSDRVQRTENKETMSVYLFPDEKFYLRSLNRANKKIGG